MAVSIWLWLINAQAPRTAATGLSESYWATATARSSRPLHTSLATARMRSRSRTSMAMAIPISWWLTNARTRATVAPAESACCSGNGNGTFQPPATYNSGGQDADSVAIGDINHDGIPDVIVANQCVSKFNCKTGGISVLLGNANGALRAASSYSSGGYTSLAVAVADVNGDGEPNIVATDLCSQSTNCVAGVVGVLLNNGNGTFQPVATYSSSGYGASSVALADVNGDGIPDLVVDNICKTSASCNVGGVSLLLGVGDGTFQTPIVYSSAGNNASSVALADLNGDSRLDIVTANSCSTKSNCDGAVAVLSNITSIKTTTSIASSINPSILNQQVIFTATMTSSPSIPNGEIVMFYHGATVLGSGTITNDVATLTTSFAKATSYTIKATYAGDAFHKKSSGTVKQVVNQ